MRQSLCKSFLRSFPNALLAAFCMAGLAMTAACAESEPVTESQKSNGTLSCHLSVTSPLQQGLPVIAELTLHNRFATSVQVLSYFTPFEGILGEIFEIRARGQLLPYAGPMVKRAAPGAEDWFVLEAGQELSATVDLSNAWDLTGAGDYQLQLRNNINYRLPGEPVARQLAAADCGVVRFTIQPGHG